MCSTLACRPNLALTSSGFHATVYDPVYRDGEGRRKWPQLLCWGLQQETSPGLGCICRLLFLGGWDGTVASTAGAPGPEGVHLDSRAVHYGRSPPAAAASGLVEQTEDWWSILHLKLKINWSFHWLLFVSFNNGISKICNPGVKNFPTILFLCQNASTVISQNPLRVQMLRVRCVSWRGQTHWASNVPVHIPKYCCWTAPVKVGSLSVCVCVCPCCWCVCQQWCHVVVLFWPRHADPRFLYATMSDIKMVEFKGETEAVVSQFFAAHDNILSFDLDWNRDQLYWANQTGHVQRTGLSRVEAEVVPTPMAGLSLLLFRGPLKYLMNRYINITQNMKLLENIYK